MFSKRNHQAPWIVRLLGRSEQWNDFVRSRAAMQSRREETAPAILWLVGAFFIVAGLVLISKSISAWSTSHVASKWPTVSASIISSEVTSTKSPNDKFTSYYANITYTYEVDGRSFTSTSVAPDAAQGGVHATADRYRPQSVHLAYYDPNNPAQAYLETNTNSATTFRAGMGGIFCLVGLGIAYAKWSGW